MTEPIRPDEVEEEKLKIIPDEAIETINSLIAQDWDGRSATITHTSLIKLLKHKMGNRFHYDWLKFESIYRKAGWRVVRDSPGYNESYETNWIFTKEK